MKVHAIGEMSYRVSRDLGEYLDRREKFSGPGYSILRLVGIDGKTKDITWPVDGPPPRLDRELLIQCNLKQSHLHAEVSKRSFSLGNCVKQHEKGKPGIWLMLEVDMKVPE